MTILGTDADNAINRLQNTYNGNAYNVSTNAGGMAGGGHRVNEIPAMQDIATVGSAIATAAQDVADVADDAATISSNIASVNTVAGAITNINTVAGISSDVAAVSGISANVTTVAGAITNINTVAGISANITTVAGMSSEIVAVVADAADIGTVATAIGDVSTVASNSANVTTAAQNITSINLCATNMTDIQNASSLIAPRKLDATRAPTVNDDDSNTGGIGLNFAAGSIWIDVNASPAEIYMCTDASTGAANWLNTSLTADELNALAFKDTVATGDIDNDAVTYDKMQNVSAQYRLLGRSSSGSGVVQEVSSSANVFSILQAASYSAIRSLLGLVIGSDVQAYDANTAKTNIAQEYTKTQNFNATTLTDAASIAWNLEDNQVASVTLAGNRTLANPTNIKDGATYILVVKQDATGSRTLSFGSSYEFPGGTAPTLSTAANAKDVLSFVAMDGVLLGSSGLDYS